MSQTRNKRPKPLRAIGKGIANTFYLESDRSARSEKEQNRMANPRRAREAEAARQMSRHIQVAAIEGETQDHDPVPTPASLSNMQRFDLKMGTILPWMDKRRSQAARIEYGGNRRKAVSWAAAAITLGSLVAIGPREMTPESSSELGGSPPPAGFTEQPQYQQATDNYLEATGREPVFEPTTSSEDTRTAIVGVNGDSIWEIAGTVTDGDRRPVVDAITRHPANADELQDGIVQPGDQLVVPE